MRTTTLCLLLAALAACHSTARPVEPLRATDPRLAQAVVEASLRREPGPAPEQVLALDPVVAQLLRASFVAYAHQRRVAIENLTNVDTCAYKRRLVQTGVQDIAGSDGQTFQLPVVLGTQAVFSTGALEITERNLDVGIDGDGFLAVTRVDGSTGYTRAGALQIDADGKFVTGTGNRVLPEITVPTDTLEISIDPEGRVTGRTAGSPDTATTFGQLTIHRFVNPGGLLAESGIYRPSDASGAPISGTPGSAGLGLLKQGFLERSNVQVTDELVRLQVLERQHDSLVAVMRQFGMVAP